jgi:hypothetical protein
LETEIKAAGGKCLPFAELKRAKMANIHQEKPEDTIVVWKLMNV